MKEKNKNILKGLGVGALACCGMFALTGCSVELSQSQVDKVMQVVDQSDKFMEDTLDLLEKQNAKLSKEEGWDLYQTALTKFLTNQNGLRNNMKITIKQFSSAYPEDDAVVDLYLYNDMNGVDLQLEKFTHELGTDVSLLYADDESGVYEYNKSGAECEKSLVGEGLLENYLSILLYVDNGVTSEDVVGCELLENGNYKLSFINCEIDFYEGEDEEDEGHNLAYYSYIVYEITSDGIFISQETNFAEVDLNKDGAVTERFGGTITYDYGVVQESDFADILEEAKAAELTEEVGE